MEREPDIDVIAEAEELPAAAAPVGAAELGAIFAGGFLGALARAALEEALGTSPASWPWPTFAVNLAAAALLGYAIAWLGGHHPRTMRARAFLATGVCGALSTFSTVMVELIHLREQAGLGLACAYGAASIAGGLAAVALGVRLGSRAEAR
ncbi:MAG TPA: fluoride efflux transporter CrcB [Solirubrobacteraceae bacterium]|nr:fluoride efflux transporter CrcB [Solirubrobacteraceae bacterium]